MCYSLEGNAQTGHPRLRGFTLSQPAVVASQDCDKQLHDLTEFHPDTLFHPQPGYQQPSADCIILAEAQ